MGPMIFRVQDAGKEKVAFCYFVDTVHAKLISMNSVAHTV